MELIPFDYEGTSVRTIIGSDGEPWFVASDVATVLGYASAKDFTRGVDEEDRGRQIVPTPSGHQEMTIISEPGLYTALVRSRAERVQPFRRWVTGEVLPQIRKTGGYGAPALTGPELMAAALIRQSQMQMELCQAAKGLIHPDHLEAKARIVLDAAA